MKLNYSNWYQEVLIRHLTFALEPAKWCESSLIFQTVVSTHKDSRWGEWLRIILAQRKTRIGAYLLVSFVRSSWRLQVGEWKTPWPPCWWNPPIPLFLGSFPISAWPSLISGRILRLLLDAGGITAGSGCTQQFNGRVLPQKHASCKKIWLHGI